MGPAAPPNGFNPTYGNNRLDTHLFPVTVKEDDLVVQVIPSDDVAILFVPTPVAIHKLPFHEIPFTAVNPMVDDVQVIPSDEYAIYGDVVTPPATHIFPFHAIDLASEIELPVQVTGDQLIPFAE